MTKKEIAKFIYDELSYMYCDNCRYHSENGWGISMAEAERIAEMIGGKVETEMSLPKWIPCSKMLPKAEDMYQPPEQRYLCQLEAYGERKFCVLSRLKGAVSPFWDWYGVAVHDHEVIAWMRLPDPYKAGDDE